MKKIERKHKAQEMLVISMATAAYHVADDESLSEKEKDLMLKEMYKQMIRVEKLFGYKPTGRLD